tara:strand:- start:117 stop:449 length:333 start_codon:yes stop_codon:yes gene_type:complete
MKRDKYTLIPFNFISTPTQIKEAANVVRWNPALAIDWMKEAGNKVNSPLHINMWNKAAKRMNTIMDDIESTRYYSKEEYWGKASSTRLELIEEIMSLEDYIAFQQYSAKN